VNLAHLNPPQRQAVEHGNGPLLIFAGPGSGKTATITHRVARLIERGVPAGRILLVTFTNRAAREMMDRVDTLCGEASRRLVAGTFHSVCARYLRKHAERIGRTPNFSIYDTDDQHTVLRQIVADLKLEKDTYGPDNLAERISVAKQRGLVPGDVDPKDEFEKNVEQIWLDYEKALIDGNALDFEDLICAMMRMAEADDELGASLRARFDHVLVDEFQDVNLTQYRLIRALGSKRNVCVVGDDAQAIYNWRGADRTIIRGFKTDYPDATVIKLEQNYRSSGHIVGATLALVKHGADCEPKQLWTANPPGPRVAVIECPREREEGRFITDNIRHLLGAGTERGQIAVLYRMHSLSRAIEDPLRLAAIPYVVVGGYTFYERREVRDILGYLQMVVNRDSNLALERIINCPPRGIGPATLRRLREMARRKHASMWSTLPAAAQAPDIKQREQDQLAAFRTLMEDALDKAVAMRPADVARYVVHDMHYRRMWERQAAEADTWTKKQEAHERALNCDQMIESVAEYERRTLDVGATPTLTGYLHEVALLTDRDKAHTGDRVTLMTYHASKGTEFNYVFVPAAEHGICPSSREIGRAHV